MIVNMRRPSTSHSYRRSRRGDPKVAWGAEESLPGRFIVCTNSAPRGKLNEPHLVGRKRVNHLKMENGVHEQSMENIADVFPRNHTNLSNEKHNEVNSNGHGLKDPEYFYLTSHKKDFIGYQYSPAQNARPKSAHCYARPPPSNLGKTSYQEDFGGIENANPAKPILADGPKRNNPHPLQSFMVWKVPRDLPLNEPVHDIDLEGIERASRALLNSTYKTDYLGLSQGVRMEEAMANISPGVKSNKPPHKLDSTKRIDYQNPQRHGNLKNNTSRYGCNSLKHIPATGVVPNISLKSSSVHPGAGTIYSDEFTDKTENKRRMEIGEE